MQVMEAEKVVDALEGLAKSKNPTVYLVARNGGVFVYMLPKKKRELECVPMMDGTAKWPATNAAEARAMIADQAGLAVDAYNWVAL